MKLFNKFIERRKVKIEIKIIDAKLDFLCREVKNNKYIKGDKEYWDKCLDRLRVLKPHYKKANKVYNTYIKIYNECILDKE